MSSRTLIKLALVTLALLAAGCTTAPVAEDEGPAPSPPASPPANASPREDAPPPDAPEDVRVRDEGDVRGAFDAAWSFPVASNTFHAFTVTFNLTGAEGTPAPLARVHVRLVDADGHEVRAALAGAGGEPSIEWNITVEDVVSRGEWRVEAFTPEDDPAPSAGAAEYALAVDIAY